MAFRHELFNFHEAMPPSSGERSLAGGKHIRVIGRAEPFRTSRGKAAGYVGR